MFARRLRITVLALSPSIEEGALSLFSAMAARREDAPRPVCCQKAFAEELLSLSTIRHLIPNTSVILDEQFLLIRWQ